MTTIFPRSLLFPFAIATLLIAVRPACVHATAPTDRAGAEEVVSVELTVTDLERSKQFFADVLAFEPGETVETASGRHVPMRLGQEVLVLTQPSVIGRPVPSDSRSNDLWFQHIAIVVRDMAAAYARLQRCDVKLISREPQRLPDWNLSAAGIQAVYFRDPDGHALELIQFPAGKGLARWHEPTDRLFLGIDHTAIAVSDTEQSLSFYRDQLGLSVVGTSENFGPEQERLNDVPGAHLRITTLRAKRGPGVELLQYLFPNDGRPFPPEPRAADVFHWRITIRQGPAISRSTTSEAMDMRDPDGHAVRLLASQKND